MVRMMVWCLAPVLALSCIAAPAAEALQVTPAAPKVGEFVAVRATVGYATSAVYYAPAIYVDWRGGACPASVVAARRSAIGDGARGIGLAEPAGSAGDGRQVVQARVLAEQPRQRICAYGEDGTLDDTAIVAGTPSWPPVEQGRALTAWGLGGSRRASPYDLSLQLRFRGLRPSTRSPLELSLFCNFQRFLLDPRRVRLQAGGAFSYRAALRADNDPGHYEPGLRPPRYTGRASLVVRGTIAVGAKAPRAPVGGLGGGLPDRFSATDGVWGYPLARLAGSIRTPGMPSYRGRRGCGSRVRLILSPDPDDGNVHPGQGSAVMGIGTRSLSSPPEEAGVPLG